MNQVEAILAGPGRVICSALKANISMEQCSRNQAQARMRPDGPLYHCLKCRQPDRSRAKVRPRAQQTHRGLTATTKGYWEAKANGTLDLVQTPTRRAAQILRDKSVRAGWTTKQIDRMLRRLNDAKFRDRRGVLDEWAREVGSEEA